MHKSVTSVPLRKSIRKFGENANASSNAGSQSRMLVRDASSYGALFASITRLAVQHI
jgi:hypothetical protein